MVVIVCGGRHYNNKTKVFLTLDKLLEKIKADDLTIVQGGAQGADGLARQWCRMSKVRIVNVPADWKRYGNSAGPRRNEEMLIKYPPDLVIAFPGGEGTEHMAMIAREAGIEVQRVQDDPVVHRIYKYKYDPDDIPF